MRNYRKYTPGYRGTIGQRPGQPHKRNRLFVVLAGIVVILLFVAYLKSGKKVVNNNNGISNLNLAVGNVSIQTPGLSTANCSGVIGSANTTEKVVALTYDIGTSLSTLVKTDVTKTISAAQAVNVPATFFITGTIIDPQNFSSNANVNSSTFQANQNLIASIHTAGFPIYNHSYDNPHFTSLTDRDIQAQLQKTDDLIKVITNVSTKPYARVPWGDANAHVVDVMKQAGYCPITWTVDGLDIETSATLDSVSKRINTYIKPGGIILLHAASDLAATATPRIVSELQAKGYRFVSLDELFKIAQPTNSNSNSNSTLNQNANSSQAGQNQILPA